MDPKSWRSSILLITFCGMIMKAKQDPIVYRERSLKFIPNTARTVPLPVIQPQPMKRNVNEGEQQELQRVDPWITKSISLSSSTTSADLPQNEITPPGVAIAVVKQDIPETEETTEKPEENIEKLEEKPAIPVITTVAKTGTAITIKSLQLGQSCDPRGEVSVCSPENSTCMKLAETSDIFICDCKAGFEADSLASCVPTVRSEGSPCNYRKEECDQSSTFLACINSRCICEKSDIYNFQTKKCDAKVGGTCFGEKTCITNAHCSKLSYSDFTTSPVGVCHCKQGFVESENSMCLRAYGRTCSRNEECDHVNLVCREGFCNCKDSLQKYDFKSKSCRSVVGAECSGEEGDSSCVEGAYCKITNRKMPGRCYCLSNLKQSEYRTCVSSYF